MFYENIMNLLDPEIYVSFNQFVPYLVVWIFLFFVESIIKIFMTFFFNKNFSHKGIKSELPGLPLTLLHTYVWVLSIIKLDLVTFILFSWWGPGFLVSAYLFLFRKDFDWRRWGKVTAYLCKITYVIYMGLFYYLEVYDLLFVFSAWIIQDQICLIWFEENADRTRRTFEDKWLFRLLYPGLLFSPYFLDMSYAFEYQVFGTLLFIVWVLSVIKITFDGKLHNKPHSYKEFLRNIVYEKK